MIPIEYLAWKVLLNQRPSGTQFGMFSSIVVTLILAVKLLPAEAHEFRGVVCSSGGSIIFSFLLPINLLQK